MRKTSYHDRGSKACLSDKQIKKKLILILVLENKGNFLIRFIFLPNDNLLFTMSTSSTPSHTPPNSFDSQYSSFDSNFTAEITSRMRVPDKICVIEGADPPDPQQHDGEVKARMNVPERILVAGDNKHIAVRESVPELKFDTPFPIHLPNLVLAPPPNVLTIDEYPYPTVDVKSGKTEVKNTYAPRQNFDSIASDSHETSMNTSINPEDEMTKLRVQMRQLSRRVLAIEQENQQRQQREIILYTLSISYIFIKTLLWLHRQF